MKHLFLFVLHHSAMSAIVFYAIGSAFVDALPEPVTLGNPVYAFFYKFFHLLAMNITTVTGRRTLNGK